MIKEKISIMIFFLNVFFFCFNLQSRVYDYYKITFFWLTILIMIGTIIYQIYYVKKTKVILFEIIFFYLILHLVYQIGYFGLRGSDSYFDFNFLKTILNNNQFVLGTDYMSGWPLLHIFSSVNIMVTNLNPLLFVKFLPSFFSSLIVISIYLLVYNIYKEEKVALLACLIFGSIPQLVSFESVFVREIFGIYFFVFFLFILYVSKQRNDYRFKLLSLLLIPVILFAHHFSAFMLIIFLTIYFFASTVIPYFYKKSPSKPFSIININTFYLLIFAVVFSYWLFSTFFIFNEFFSIFYNVIGIREFMSYGSRINLGTPIVTLYGNIKYYGFFFFNGIFCLIIFIKLFMRKNKHLIEEFSFTFFLYFCLFLGFLSLFMLGSLIFPDRFLPFGFMLGVIPFTMFLFIVKNKMIKRAVFVFFVSFLIFNIYNIDTDQYIGEAYTNGGITTEKEYAVAESINFPDSYYGYIGASNAIFDVQGIRPSNQAVRNPLSTSDFLHVSEVNTSNVTYINGKLYLSIDVDGNISYQKVYLPTDIAIIYKAMYLKNLENTRIKTPQLYDRIMTFLSYENFHDVNKIQDLGDIFIVAWKYYSLHENN